MEKLTNTMIALCGPWRSPVSWVIGIFLGIFLTPSILAQEVVLNSNELIILNKLQSARGQNRPFVQLDPILTEVARARAADMAGRHYYSHTDPEGFGPNHAVIRAGYVLPEFWPNLPGDNNIESVSAGRFSAEDTWISWMQSPHHKTHLLAENPAFVPETSVGVGYVEDPSSDYKCYWVVLTAPPPIPTITFVSPRNEASLNSPEVVIAGATNGPIRVQSVRFRLPSGGSSEFRTANGDAKWSFSVIAPAPGPFSVQVQSLSESGAILAESVRTFHYLVERPLAVGIVGEGTVTKGFAGTSQRAVGEPFTITADSKPGWVFAGWSGGITAPRPVQSVLMVEGMELTANFIPNPFSDRKGVYTGLIDGRLGGFFSLSLTANGRFTARILQAGKTYLLRSQFTADGTAVVQVVRNGLPPLTASLQLDLSTSGGGVTGTINDGAETATLSSPRGYRHGIDGPSVDAGSYTVSLPWAVGAPDGGDAGSGLGILYVSRFARARFSGLLPEGTSFSLAATLSDAHSLAIYTRLRAGRGVLQGTSNLRATETSDLDGTTRWSRGEVTADLRMEGSKYSRPRPGSPVLIVTTGTINSQLLIRTSSDANPIAQPTMLIGTTRLEAISQILPFLTAHIDPRTGLFSGRFNSPSTGMKSTFKGVILQKQNAGVGYVLSSGGNGYASLEVTRWNP